MKAWSIKKPGGREQLRMEERDKPVPAEDDILIEVKAVGINRTDIMTRENHTFEAPYPVLGVEISGVVVENRSLSSSIEVGTRVAGIVNRGGCAEYVIMPADRVMVLPDSLSFEEAAGIPEVFLTAYQTLYWLGELEHKERVLIHAAGSGVGTAAIQLAHQLSQAIIFATAGHVDKLKTAKELGADILINYKQESFDKVVLQETSGQGTDVILDFVGASYWRQNLKSCALDARWVLIGVLGGWNVERVSLIELMQRRIALKGTLLTPRSDAYKAKLTQEFSRNVLPLFESGQLKPLIHSVLSFSDLPEAHRQMEENENTGKIILSMGKD